MKRKTLDKLEELTGKDAGDFGSVITWFEWIQINFPEAFNLGK